MDVFCLGKKNKVKESRIKPKKKVTKKLTEESKFTDKTIKKVKKSLKSTKNVTTEGLKKPPKTVLKNFGSEPSPTLSPEERRKIFKKKIRKVMKRCSEQDSVHSPSPSISYNPLFNFKNIDIE
ncbi:unnamed protein product [Moneuplotes crassus]|uniref:Uncharacterized protein n=1 Tax=Euplotes crassus TaxID=5936 RepID=A0AAD1XR44_EUPCR|nr:unnamed protein product [Moneuplotes crassus]